MLWSLISCIDDFTTPHTVHLYLHLLSIFFFSACVFIFNEPCVGDALFSLSSALYAVTSGVVVSPFQLVVPGTSMFSTVFGALSVLPLLDILNPLFSFQYLTEGSCFTERLELLLSDSLFTLPDSHSDSDSKPDGYIVLCRNIHIGSDPDPDPCTESFLNHYCTHFRDRYQSRGQMSIPIPYISIRGSESGSDNMNKPLRRCILGSCTYGSK